MSFARRIFLTAAALGIALIAAGPAGAADDTKAGNTKAAKTPKYGATLVYMIPADSPPSSRMSWVLRHASDFCFASS